MQRCRSRPRPLKTLLQSAYANVADMSCDESINEVFLLHGTKPEVLFNVLSNGLDEGFSDGLFGQGTYLGENPCKNDQYVTVDASKARSGDIKKLHDVLYKGDITHPGGVYYLLLCRAAMGYYACTKDAETIDGSSKSLWAINQRVLGQIPNSSYNYHSLVAKTGDRILRHREFIMFKGARVYPEYVLAYQRA